MAEYLYQEIYKSSFNKIYEFRLYDFYFMAICIVFCLILNGFGVFLYISNNSNNDIHLICIFCAIISPICGILFGVYSGCIWYCFIVSKGRMDYYLGQIDFVDLNVHYVIFVNINILLL